MKGLCWPPTFDRAFQAKTACLQTSQREKEILYLEEHMSVPAAMFTPGEFAACDLNLSLDWGSWQSNVISCITCTSTIWVRGKKTSGEVVDRLLTGQEALALQGFSDGSQLALTDQLSLKQQMDLAGNAFSAESFARVVLASIMTLRLDESVAMLQQLESDDDDAEESGEEEDTDRKSEGSCADVEVIDGDVDDLFDDCSF